MSMQRNLILALIIASMAAAAAAAAAHRASSSNTYNVFLSFRGTDTRWSFADHLYSALINAGFHTFRDDDEISCGENIESEIQWAIYQSELSVIVFSKDFASSTYCLDEVVMIMERRRSAGHFVLPVFYDADPSHVSEQTGTYGEAFARHEQSFKAEPEKVERWRAALREISDLPCLVLKRDRYEGQFIQDIVREVRGKLNPGALHVTPHAVGVESLLQSWTVPICRFLFFFFKKILELTRNALGTKKILELTRNALGTIVVIIDWSFVRFP